MYSEVVNLPDTEAAWAVPHRAISNKAIANSRVVRGVDGGSPPIKILREPASARRDRNRRRVRFLRRLCWHLRGAPSHPATLTLRDPSREISRRVKKRILYWMLFGLLGFAAGSLL